MDKEKVKELVDAYEKLVELVIYREQALTDVRLTLRNAEVEKQEEQIAHIKKELNLNKE